MPTASLTIKNWYGDRVGRAAKGFVADVLNETADAAVDHVKSSPSTPVRTGFMRDTFEVLKRATINSLEADWGNEQADYTIWVEIGSQGRPGRYMMREAQQVATSGLLDRIRSRVRQ